MARSNRYVSYLGIDVEPRALSTLTQFEKATEDTFRRIESLSSKAGAGVSVGGFDARARSQVTQTTAALGRAESQIERTGVSARVAAGDTSLLANSLLRAGQSLNVVQGPLGPLAGRLSSLGGIFRDLAGFTLAGVLGGGGAFALSSIAASYQNITDRLRPFYDSQLKLNEALGEVKRVANDTRQPLEAIADLYSRIHQYAVPSGAVDESQVGRVTDIAAKAARLSGGTKDTQERGLTQFNQAIGFGKFQGDDLKRTIADVPQLAAAIAKGLDVPIGKLKELGAQGVLTSKVVLQALLRSGDEVDAQFSRLPVRIGQALTIAETNLAFLIGRIDDATGSTTGLAKAIEYVGNNLGNVATLGGTAIAAFSARGIVNQFRTVEATIDGVTVAQQGLFAKLASNARSYSSGVSAALTQPLRVYRDNAARTAGTREVFGPTAQTFTAGRSAEASRGFSSSIATRAELEATRTSLRAQLDLIAAQRDEALSIRRSLESGETALAREGAQARLVILEAELEQQVAAQEAGSARVLAARAALSSASGAAVAGGVGATAGAEAAAIAHANLTAATADLAQIEARTQATNDRLLAMRRVLEDGETGLAQQGAQERIAILEAELAQRAAAQEAAVARLSAAQFAQPQIVSQFTTVGPNAAATAEAVVAADAEIEAATVSLSRTQTLAEGTARRLDQAYAQLAATTAAASETTAAAIAEQNSVIATSTAARLRTESTLAAVDADLAAAQAAVAGSGNVMAIALQADAVAAAEAAAAEAALATETGVLAAAMATAEGVMGALAAASKGLVALLGGPVGVVLTAVAGGMLYLATRTNAAKDAADNFSGGQEELNRRLGLTTGSIAQQTGALRILNIELARSALIKAQQKARDAGQDLGASIGNAAQRVGLLSGQGRSDISALIALRQKADAGTFDLKKDYPSLNAIQQRNPNAFAHSGLNAFFGGDPADAAVKVKGVAAANFELADSMKALNDLSAPAKSRAPLPSLLKTGGSGRSAEEIKADAIATVQSGKAVVDARRRYKAEIDKADAEFKKTGDEAAYTASIEKSQRALDAVTNAQGARTRGLAAGRAALRNAIADENDAGKSYQKLTAIIEQYSGDSSRLVKLRKTLADIANEGSKVDRTGKVVNPDSFTDPVTKKTVTKADATAAVNKAFTKPYDDIVLSQDKALEQSDLLLRGLGDRAALMKQANDLAKTQIGDAATYKDLSQGQLDTLRDQYFQQQKLNDALEERNKIVEIYSTAIGSIQDAFTNLLSGGKIKDFGKQIQQAFTRAQAQKLTLAIFGDPERDFRNSITRGIDAGATRLKSSADNLDTAATNLTNAATSLANPTGGASAGDPTSAATANSAAFLSGTINDAFGPTSSLQSALKRIDQLNGNQTNTASGSAGAGEIVVTGARATSNDLPGSVRELYNQQFSRAGVNIAKTIERVFGRTPGTGTSATTKLEKTLGKVGGIIGTALQGAAIGATASGVFASVTGVKTSKAGSQIGGAAGGFAAKALGLPPIVGQIVGGVLGGVIGGLFKKTPRSSATISSIEGAATVTGSSSATKKAAAQEATGVQSGLQSIVDQLGGTAGSFSVSIGTRKKKFVVDPTGQGRTKGSGVQKYDTEEEATQAAILDAINDGAVKGIRQGALNLLKAGSDLNTQLAKAVKFQDVFTELKQIKDPVGAAVDALNLRFQGLISIFNQAGASASDFASLKELYDLKRADAVKTATDTAITTIQDFINGITSSSDSPLNKATTYQNARSQVQAFRSDLDGGKAVDQDALVKALTTYQTASRNLNGSGTAFFNDFEDILKLANEAKANAGAATAATASTPGPLAASPFDTTSTTKAVADGTSNIVDAVNTQTATLAALLGLPKGVTATAPASASAISLLAGRRAEFYR